MWGRAPDALRSNAACSWRGIRLERKSETSSEQAGEMAVQLPRCAQHAGVGWRGGMGGLVLGGADRCTRMDGFFGSAGNRHGRL